MRAFLVFVYFSLSGSYDDDVLLVLTETLLASPGNPLL